MTRRRYLALLAIAFAAVWALLAISPSDRADWALENVLAVVGNLGTQGDVWDAHKDMALASIGAIIGMTITAAINVRLQRDFAHEWLESLRVKGRVPLGEDEIARMLRQRDRV